MQTEITVQVFNPKQEIESILREKGFAVTETYTMHDWYFSKHSWRKIQKLTYPKLLQRSFLVRSICGQQQKHYITYKNKMCDKKGNCLQEEKINVCVNDAEKAVTIFQKAQCTLWAEVKNVTTVYKKEHICFALQDIDGLGIFLEFEESEDMKHMSVLEKICVLSLQAQNLGLTLGNDYFCKKPYLLLHNLLLHKKAR